MLKAVGRLEVVVVEQGLGQRAVQLLRAGGELAGLGRADVAALAAAEAHLVHHGVAVLPHLDGVQRAALHAGAALDALVEVDH